MKKFEATTAIIIQSKTERGAKYTKTLQGTNWQTIQIDLSRTDNLRHAFVRFHPIDKPGVVRIKSIKMLNMATGIPWCEMHSPEDFDILQINDMLIRLPDKTDLLLIVTGPVPEISWNCGDTYVDCPTSLEIKIKVEFDHQNLSCFNISCLANVLKELLMEGCFVDALYIYDHFPNIDIVATQDPQLIAWLIRLLLEYGRILQAAHCYVQAVIAKMELPVSPMEIGKILESNEHWEEARVFYENVIDLNKKNISAQISKIGVLNKLDHLDEAARVSAETIEKFNHSPALHIDLGLSHLINNDRQSALLHFQAAQKHSTNFPLWGNRAISALSKNNLNLFGVRLQVPPEVVSPDVLQHMIKGSYEHVERRLAKSIIQSGDRVLELGGGVGYIACTILTNIQDVVVCTVEANPALIPLIKENLRLNNCNAKVVQGLASDRDGQAVFHVAENFWASSTVNIPGRYSRQILPTVDTNQLIRNFKPNKIIIDIEGGEVDLIPKLNLQYIDALVIEVHQKFTGMSGVSTVMQALFASGFVIDLDQSGGHVYVFFKG